MSYFSNLFNAALGRGGRQTTSGGGFVNSFLFGDREDANIHDAMPQVSMSEVAKVGPVAACTDLIADRIAMLPLRMYRRNAEGIDEEVKTGPGRVLNHQWSRNWTRVAAIRYLVTQTLNHGSGFAHITRNERMEVSNITPVPSDCVTVVRQNGDLQYELRGLSGETIQVFPSSDIIDIVFKFKDNGFDRQGKLEEVREPATRYLLIARAARRYNVSGAPSHAVVFPTLTNDQMSSEAQAIMQANVIAATRESHRVGNPYQFFPGGTTLTRLGSEMEKNQLHLQMQSTAQQIAQIYDVPPNMIGDLTKSTFNNQEQNSIFFVQNVLQPRMTAIEQEINSKLWGGQRGNQNYVRFDWSEIVRADLGVQANVAVSLVQNGIATQNEAREMTGLARINEAQYDELRQQAQMVPAGGADETDDGGGDEPDEDGSGDE